MKGKPIPSAPWGGLKGITDFLRSDGQYWIGNQGAWLQIEARSPDGRSIIWSPFALRPDLLTPESAADLAAHLDILLGFYGGQGKKIRDYLRSLGLPRDWFSDSARDGECYSEEECWLEAEKSLLRCMMSPGTWNLEMNRSRRRAYIRKSVCNWMVNIRKDQKKERKNLDIVDDLDDEKIPTRNSEVDLIAKIAAQEERNAGWREWMFSQPGLTARDEQILSLCLEGYPPAEACRIVGGPELSPWVSVRQKLARRKPPKDFL